jgi:hypothetical protein
VAAAGRVGEPGQAVLVEAPAPVPHRLHGEAERVRDLVLLSPAAERRMICARRTWLYGSVRECAAAVSARRSVSVSVSSNWRGRPVSIGRSRLGPRSARKSYAAN